MGGVAAYGGPVGLIAGGIYFAIDATIGWDSALRSMDHITGQNRAILGNSWHSMGFGDAKW